MKHTQEPWQGESLAIYAVINGRKTMIGQLGVSSDAGVSSETCAENVKRIAACVNACAGLPTDMLEGASAVDGLVSSIIEVSNQRADAIKKLEAQRAELFAELKAARRAIRAIKREQGKWDYGRELCINADKRATKAITKAEAANG